MAEKKIRPLLAVDVPLEKIKYPILVSPKLDGIRAMRVDGVLRSRSGKPIRNEHTQEVLDCPTLDGLDGELISGS